MTLKEFLDNPAGKGDSSMNRAALIGLLNNKYEALTRSKSISVRVYRTFGTYKSHEYFIHLVIPTETERDNTYDVVFHLYNPDKAPRDVKNYDVKFFSNTPSFAYTFAYVYYQNGIFEETLMDKFDKQFFKEKPKERNQYEIVNYDKYLYFGARYVLDAHMLSRGGLDLRSLTYVKRTFNSKIRTFDVIMNEYNKAKRKLKRSSSRDVKTDTKKTKERKLQPGTRKIEPVEPKAPKVRKPTKPATKNVVRKIQKK